MLQIYRSKPMSKYDFNKAALLLVLAVALNKYYQAVTLLFKVNNKDNKNWPFSGVFFLNFEQISHLYLLFPLLTLKNQFDLDAHRNHLSFDFILCASLQYLSEKAFIKFLWDIFFLWKNYLTAPLRGSKVPKIPQGLKVLLDGLNL